MAGCQIRVRKNLCGLAFVALTALGGGAAQAAEVVCLGASYVQGWGVAPNEAFPAQLEAMLHAKGINVAVANVESATTRPPGHWRASTASSTPRREFSSWE